MENDRFRNYEIEEIGSKIKNVTLNAKSKILQLFIFVVICFFFESLLYIFKFIALPSLMIVIHYISISVGFD